MNRGFYLAAGALLLAAFGCKDDGVSPTESSAPATPQLSASAAAALTFRQISAGGEHSCGVTSDNLAYCWGWNEYGQLGNGNSTGPEACAGANGSFACSTRPVLVTGGHHFRQVRTGRAHTCGVTTDNRAFCWGYGFDGALGNGTTAHRASPVAVAGGRQFRQIEAGYSHTCGVTPGDRAFCWGTNHYGELGNGTTTASTSPVAVAGGLAFKQVSPSAGYESFSCGVTTDARAFCWGSNRNYQLGDGTTAKRRLRPTPVAGGRSFRQVDAGYFHACGTTTDNRAFCWGNGRSGALGNGKDYLSFVPRAVSGGLSFLRVTAGSGYSCGVTTAGRGYCWGSNGRGKLGDGTTDARFTPVPIAGGLTFSELSAGSLHTCGPSSAGKGYCWGYGFFGQLGNGTSSLGAEEHTPSAVLEPI